METAYELKRQMREAHTRMSEIIETAQADGGRDLTEAENREWENLDATFDQCVSELNKIRKWSRTPPIKPTPENFDGIETRSKRIINQNEKQLSHDERLFANICKYGGNSPEVRSLQKDLDSQGG